MKLMSSLALKHLQKNKRQTLSAFLAIMLSVAMLVALSTFFFSVYDSSIEFAKAHNLEDTMSGSLNSVRTIGAFLGIVIAAAAVFVISNAFNIQAAERAKQFGILKSVGATEKQISSTVMAESNWLSLIGIPAGIILGHVLCFAAILVLKGYTGGETDGEAMEYTLHFNPLAIVLASALGYVSVRFASYLTAQKASKLTAIEAIRQTDEIKIDSRKLKTSKAAESILGFEGTLALKQMKRNKRKFRVTVISLVVSIVLFLGAFSFGDIAIRSAQGAYANTGANVVSQVVGSSSDFSAFDAYASEIKAQDIKGMSTLYSYLYAPEHGGDWYAVLAMDDADYEAYCKEAGVPLGSNILLDRGHDLTLPFTATLTDAGNVSFTVTEKTTLINPRLKSLTMTSCPTIIVSRSELQRSGLTIEAHYYIVTDKAADLIPRIQPQNSAFESYYIHNTDEYTRDMQRMYSMLMIFAYCFIGMLALIGATSVLATINSNINLRRSEFATLQAVGMETKKLRKMLNLESLFYGVKSLLYGLPIGLLISYGMYQLAVNTNFRLEAEDISKFPYEVPYLGIIACILGVVIINLISMQYATSKIRRNNIAQTMRELNC